MEMLMTLLDRYARDRKECRGWDIVGISEAQWYVYKKKEMFSPKLFRIICLYFGADMNEGIKRLTGMILKRYWEECDGQA
jgi:hypothetical protein